MVWPEPGSMKILYCQPDLARYWDEPARADSNLKTYESAKQNVE